MARARRPGMPAVSSTAYFRNDAAWSDEPRATVVDEARVEIANASRRRPHSAARRGRAAARPRRGFRRSRAAYGFGRSWLCPAVRCFAQPHLDDEIVGVAAIDGSRELDRPCRWPDRKCVRCEDRPRPPARQQAGIRRAETRRRNALHRPHRPVAGRLQRGIERGADGVRVGQHGWPTATPARWRAAFRWPMRSRLTRATFSPADRPSIIISSGDGANRPRSSHVGPHASCHAAPCPR